MTQRDEEMARGRQRNEENARWSAVNAWVQAGKVRSDTLGEPERTIKYYVAGVFVSSRRYNEPVSTEVFAALSLAIAALQPEATQAASAEYERDHSYRDKYIIPSMRERYGKDF